MPQNPSFLVPNIPKLVRIQLSVTDRVLDVAATHEILQRPSIYPSIYPERIPLHDEACERGLGSRIVSPAHPSLRNHRNSK
jgi:hypothetical protein